jgi:molybdate transport system permease protein
LWDWFGFTFAFRWTGAALAAAVMAFPLMVRAIRLALEAVDPKLEEAASTLGAARTVVFLTVTLPLILPGIIAGAVLAFAKAMGEFGATITFVANIPGETQTLPTAIYSFLQVPGGDAAALRLVAISVAVAMLALVLSEVLSRRVAKRIAGR